MTNPEFSNTFDALLNSYNTQALFGEQASRMEITLDEYEKSVLLTQAQDLVVKSYFDRTLNAQGQGFDDSTRRQVDFSSLIKVAEATPRLAPVSKLSKVLMLNNKKYGILTLESTVWNEGTSDTPKWVPTDKYFRIIHDSRLEVTKGVSAVAELKDNVFTLIVNWGTEPENSEDDFAFEFHNAVELACAQYDNYLQIWLDIEGISPYPEWPSASGNSSEVLLQGYIGNAKATGSFDDRGIVFDMPVNNSGESDILFILNESVKVGGNTYIVVPINYREYDREMSKAYAQPLKKQMWRLFHNISTGYDIQSELIPKENIASTYNASDYQYKIRYVRRPQPIVLEDLPNGLQVDGVETATECELNPILHMDILNKAVELAVATRGGRQAAPQEQKAQ